MIWPGGAYEYTMGMLEGELGSSGFSTLPASKYYDIYKKSGNGSNETSNYALNSNKKGDAIYETSSNSISTWRQSWFQDYSYFVYSASPWFHFGGYYDDATVAGLFCFSSYPGMAYSSFSFRLVILPM